MKRAFTKKPTTEAADGDTGSADALSPERAWSSVLAWQTRREHSRTELADKLERLGADAALIDAILERLTTLGLQSDERAAEDVVRSQLQRGRGPRVIRQSLQQRGLVSDQALGELDDSQDWVARAQSLLRRRFGDAPPADARERARRIRFLQYRGFALGQALAALKAGGDADSDIDPGQDCG